MAESDWTGGLPADIDYMLTERPDDPELRESASFWVFEENGAFCLPRIGIEAIGKAWGTHRYDTNAVFADGRVLFESRSDAQSHSPIGADSKPSVLGTGGLAFHCIEPFRKWRVTYEDEMTDTTVAATMAGPVDTAKRARLAFDVTAEMVTPGWVQDLRPEKLAGMTERERQDAASMGLGWRVEHQFRAEGTLTIDGETRPFKGVGNRVHRQSVRPLDGFRGHCWQAAVFPDGRAFCFIAYPPAADGSTYNDGYVYENGTMYAAKATKIPFLTRLVERDEDVSLELEYELGKVRIAGRTRLNNFKVGMDAMPGFMLNQGGVAYEWDGQKAYGMIERSTWETQVG